jgi:hypothetical protein
MVSCMVKRWVDGSEMAVVVAKVDEIEDGDGA